MRQFFRLPVFADEATTSTARLLTWLLWSFLLVSILPLTLVIILPQSAVRWLVMVGVIDCLSLGLLVLVKRGYFRLASMICVVALWLIATVLASTAGGIHAPMLPGYLIIVIVTGMILGIHWGLVMAGIASLTELGMVLASQSGWLPTNRVDQTDLSIRAINGTLLVVTAAVQILATRVLQNALKQAREVMLERHKAVVELQKSEDHFRSLIENSTDIFIEMALDGKLLYISPSVERVLGYQPEEIGSKNAWDLVIPYGKGLESVILSTGKAYINNDAMHDPNLYWPDSPTNCQSLAGVPLIANEQTIGFLWAGRKTTISEGEVHLLNSIANITLPDYFFQKKDRLNKDEWDLIHQHPVRAYEMLYPIAYLCRAVDIPYCHHEKWDGTGYPRGLQGDHIPLAARIFAVVDAYMALMSERPYRSAWNKTAALEFVRANAGLQFDPQVVDSFLSQING